MYQATLKSLYEKLGGRAAVEAVISDFLNELLSDDRVSYHFVGVDIERLQKNKFKFFAELFGGPIKYTGGETLRNAHKGLNISSEEYDVFLAHLRSVLRKHGIPLQDIAKMDALIRSFKPHIINK
ncbi:group I truncated hemoglobin [Thermoflavimicrobium dichotomicum]|uniref:Hemoglobin n=1 Tax=Thermoflavimicrobium dichotomicum TaxID=46223 RepID=A0A1I3MUE1_9BACL|nr:group 1 truncated hemoglobin [Thermoflavimicrobium dichotomicum]SFJ00569.1 hemoglobin [Thermoflavimicrobium dichotomicum]